MSFTGQLGTVNSQLGNFELGAVAAAPNVEGWVPPRRYCRQRTPPPPQCQVGRSWRTKQFGNDSIVPYTLQKHHNTRPHYPWRELHGRHHRARLPLLDLTAIPAIILCKPRHAKSPHPKPFAGCSWRTPVPAFTPILWKHRNTRPRFPWAILHGRHRRGRVPIPLRLLLVYDSGMTGGLEEAGLV